MVELGLSLVKPRPRQVISCSKGTLDVALKVAEEKQTDAIKWKCV